jgi:hypothetical protein
MNQTKGRVMDKPKRWVTERQYILEDDPSTFQTYSEYVYTADEMDAYIAEKDEQARLREIDCANLMAENNELRKELKEKDGEIRRHKNMVGWNGLEITRLRKALENAIERMNRARKILQENHGGNWAMLDTTNLTEVLKEE